MNRRLPRLFTRRAHRRPFAAPLPRCLLGLLLLAVCSGSQAADSSKTATSKTAAGTPAATVFSARERNTILSHYAARQHDAEVYAQYHDSGKSKKDGSQALPPGLRKKAEQGQLPPGWQKKLRIGSKIPPDIFAVAEPLPAALVAQLPASPVGTITVHIDGQIVRVVEATRTIVDFFALNR